MPDLQDLKPIDLTLPLTRGMRGYDFENSHTIEEHGWNASTLHIYSHAGTHMDAPLHFNYAFFTLKNK